MTSEKKVNLCEKNDRSKYSWSNWICGGYDYRDYADHQPECINFEESAVLEGTCMYEVVRAEFHGCFCPEAIANRLVDMKMEQI